MKININTFLLLMISVYAQAETIEYNTNVRVGAQYHDSTDTQAGNDLALGGYLHAQTKSVSGISLGATLHTSNALFNQNDAFRVPFFTTESKSYAILSEAYIKGEFDKTTFILGRQLIDTPFLDSDDIGMVPNTFEAYTIMNQDIKDISLLYSYVRNMSGVDADIPEEFSDINAGAGAHIVGINYEAVENIALSGWFYHIPDFAKLTYLDAGYENSVESFNYALGAQVALQDFVVGESAKIFGLSASAEHQESALTLSLAYNKSFDEVAINGFGGGPFFANDEHMTLADVGKDGSMLIYGVDWDASEVLTKGLSIGIKQAQLKDGQNHEGDEADILLSCIASDRLTFDAVYSTLDNSKISGDEFDNLRVFVNYSF